METRDEEKNAAGRHTRLKQCERGGKEKRIAQHAQFLTASLGVVANTTSIKTREKRSATPFQILGARRYLLSGYTSRDTRHDWRLLPVVLPTAATQPRT